MRYLGIDYGTKNIGLALSDPDGRLAFPKDTINNNSETLQKISTIIESEGAESIVIGDSRTGTGQANKMTDELNDFVAQLTMLVGLPIHLVNEAFTSMEASKQDLDKPTARKPKGKIIKKDDSAAALILQRFLDTQ